MLVEPRHRIAYRKAGLTAFLLCLSASVTLLPSSAHAVKLFGMTFFEDEAEDTTPVIDPTKYALTFNAGTEDDDLKTAIEEGSALYTDKDKPVSGAIGVVVKARDDRERILAALYEQARYGALVSVTVNGIPVDDVPPDPQFPADQPINVAVTVTPGPVFTVGEVRLKGDAARLDPAAFGLKAGEPAGSDAILKASDKMIAALKDEGRPLARLVNRAVVADHDNSQVDIEIDAAAGPTANVGDVTVEGTEQVDPDFVADYSRLNAGRPYSPAELRKAADRLRRLGTFSAVTIKEDDHLAPDGTIPLTITTTEGKMRYFGFGAQASTLDGLGLNGYWGHRNLFGKAESLRVEGSVSRIGETFELSKLDYAAAILFSKPGAFGPPTTFNASLKAALLHPESYTAATFTAAADVEYEINDQDTAKVGVEISFADTRDVYGNNRYLTTSLPLAYLHDASNDKLDPTSGWRAMVSAKPSYESYNRLFFSSFEGYLTGYQSLGADDSVVLAGKLAAGTITGVNDLEDIPATRRFYGGGGGSVRGFGFQEISPLDKNGEQLGGRSYAFASLEARVQVTETIGIVPFFDAINVATGTAPDFKDIRMGAGIGLRYKTPFGPLRLDVAVPLNPYKDGSRFGIYAGIGQSF